VPSPPLVINACVQIRLLQSVAGQGAVNVLHAIKPGTLVIDQTLANTVGAAIKGAYTTNMLPLMGPNTALVRVGLRDLTAANSTEFLDAGAATGVGAGTESLPAQDALCITLRTAQSGKSARGRVYLSGFSEAQNTSVGLAATTAVDGAVAFIVAIQTALAASNMNLAVASRPAYAFIDTRTWTLPTGTEVDTIGRGNARPGQARLVTIIQSRNAAWETQRRRNNGRGAQPTIFAASREVTLGQPA